MKWFGNLSPLEPLTAPMIRVTPTVLMELTLLGTAAAEGWPAPFCSCTHCESARERGGPNLRSRSGALLDGDIKIDWSADSIIHMQRVRKSLAGIKTLLFTHQHTDHIDAPELVWAKPPFTQTPPEPFEILGNRQVLEIIEKETGTESTGFKPRLLEPFLPVTTAGDTEVLPLPADHVAGALVLRITRGGKTLFYGHDSGLYPKETLDALMQGPKLDIVLFDCTNGGAPTSNRGHMGISGVAQMAAELRERGCLNDGARLIATHFSHNGGLLHEELVQACLPFGLEVAFDGMVVRS